MILKVISEQKEIVSFDPLKKLTVGYSYDGERKIVTVNVDKSNESNIVTLAGKTDDIVNTNVTLTVNDEEIFSDLLSTIEINDNEDEYQVIFVAFVKKAG